MVCDLVQWLRKREDCLVSFVFSRHSDLLDHLGELLRLEDVEGFSLSDLWLGLNWVIEEHFLLLSHSQFLLQLLTVEPLDLLWVGDCFSQANFLFLRLGLAWKLAWGLTLSLYHLDLYSLLLVFFK